MNVDTVAML